MSKRYAGLTRRSAEALQNHPDLAAHITAILEAGGKVTRTTPATGGRKRITFCLQEGSGHRSNIEVAAGQAVHPSWIKKQLAKSGFQPRT